MAGMLEKSMPTIQRLAAGLALTTPEGAMALHRYGWYKWLTARPEIEKEAERTRKARLMLEVLQATGGRPTPQMLATLAKYGIEWPKERVEIPGIKERPTKTPFFGFELPGISIPPTVVERPRAVPSPLAEQEMAMQTTLLDVLGRIELEKLRQKGRRPSELEIFAWSLGYPSLQDLTPEQARDLMDRWRASRRTWPAELWLYARALNLDKKLKEGTITPKEAEKIVTGYRKILQKPPRMRELDMICLKLFGKTADEIKTKEEADKVIKLLQTLRRQDFITMLMQALNIKPTGKIPKGAKPTGEVDALGRPIYELPDGTRVVKKIGVE